jgi:acyl carrier protein phosphodiesterase
LNFLAHCLLSFDNEALLLGNFIADDIKGKKYQDFPIDIQKGILLHREIDTFTDSHPLVKETKILFRPVFDKFSGPLVDIFYDHLLAIHWNQYSDTPLRTFTDWAYNSLQKNIILIPEESRYFLDYVHQHDILFAYKEKKAIIQVLNGMTERYHSPYILSNGYPIFEENREAIENQFAEFMPQMISHAKSTIKILLGSQ